MTLWQRVADLCVSRSRAMLACIAAATLFFAACLTRIEVDTNFLSFVHPETRRLVDVVEDDFSEGSYVTLIFESRTDRSLLEPDLLQQQLRIMRAIHDAYAVTTFSLVEGIDRGLQRVRRKSLLEVDDYSDVAETIMGLAGGRTVRDLEKVSAHFLSHPEAVGFYRRLRLAQSLGAVQIPGAPETTYGVPFVKAIKALVRLETEHSREERRDLLAALRDRVDSLATEELALHVLNDDLVGYDVDRETERSVALLAGMIFLVDLLCIAALFRSRREVFVVFAVLVASSVWTFGLAGLLGIRLSFLHLLGVPILLGTGIDDTLIFGRRLGEETRPGRSLSTALRATYAGVGNAVFLTTFTTLLAFLLAAWAATAPVVASFYGLVAVSMAIVLVLTLLLEGSLRVELARGDAPGGADVRSDSPLERITHPLARASRRTMDLGPVPILLASGAFLVLALASATRLDSEISRSDVLKPSMPTWGANQALQRYFGDSRVGYVLFEGEVESPALLEKLRVLEERLAGVPEIEQVLGSANVDSVIGLLDKQGVSVRPETDVRALFDRIRGDERTADYALDMSFREAFDYVVRSSGGRYDALLLRFFVPGEAGSRALAACDAIRREMRELGLDRLPGVSFEIGGGDVLYPLESVKYNGALALSFAVSLIGNFLVLLVAWRRLVPALVAMAPLVLAAAAVVGAMPLFGITLNPLNLGIGAIVVGLGIDYPIHLLERYDEERRERGRLPREAAGVALDTMGPHILAGMLTTSLGFCASFALLLPISTSFGLMTGAAIAIVYLGSLFVLPALRVGGAWAARGGSSSERS